MLRRRETVMVVFIMSFLSSLFGCRRTQQKAPNGPRQGQTENKALKRLGIFYGWPSAFDGAKGPEAAAAKLGRYQVVVLGGGLEQAEHGDHENTRTIIGSLRKAGVEVFGYIPLGASTGLDKSQIKRRVKAWKAMEVDGVFYDEAGHDYGNTRERQNSAFKIAHRQGLKVFANAWDPDDLFSTKKNPPHNASGAGSELKAGDCYLYESFGLVEGKPEREDDREVKMRKLEPARKKGVRIFGVTTSPSAGFFDAGAWGKVVAEARRLGLSGVGWGEHQFAAPDNKMPDRPFPK
jgi:hypothetical protein